MERLLHAVEQAALKLYKGEDKRTITKVTPKSDRLFDLSLEGQDNEMGCLYSAWLPLGLIHDLHWTTPEIANMTDYPAMARSGDWSGVRDTDAEKLWLIFHRFVLPLIFKVEEGG